MSNTHGHATKSRPPETLDICLEEQQKQSPENESRTEHRQVKKAARHLLAGGCAGLVECLMMHPLDVLKTRFQIQRGPEDPQRYSSIADCVKKMARNEGALSFYKGILPRILQEAPRATKFFTFECNKSLLKSLGYTGPMSLAVAGLGTGTVEGFVVTPFERVKVQLQAQRHRMSEQPSTWSCAREIVQKNGFGSNGLYKGWTATVARHGTWNGLYFGIYHNLRGILLDPQNPSIPSRLALGVLAGSVASVSNLPFDVAKSRIQGPQPPGHPNKYRSVIATIVTVFKEEGFLALYKGLVPRVLRLGPGGAIMFLVYEQVSKFLEMNGL